MSAPADTGDGAKKGTSEPQVKPSENLTATATQKEEEFPDPDEDDLDDLDDMLDEFSSVKINQNEGAPPAQKAQSASKSSQQPTATAPPQESTAEENVSPEEFAKQLEAGMADLLGELEQSPEMKKQFEDLFKSMGGAAAAESSTKTPTDAAKDVTDSTTSKPASSEPNLDSFQDTIRRTMERMQASGESATAAASSSTEEDFMTELLKQMSSGDLGAEGGEEEFSKMLMGMMEQLTNKDILYEPMKELHDKFPEWLAKNRDKTSEEDLKRYEDQKAIVADIVGKFEESTYSDENTKDREFIVDKMQQMQAAGSPPTDLVGDMASAQEAFTGPDDQCNPQ